MADKDSSLFSRIFHHDGPEGQTDSSEQPPAPAGGLSGDNTVAEWLDHPIGGAILRDMLQQAGQSEKALRPVRRLSMNRLIKLSHGRFTEDMLAGMIEKVSAGQVPAGTAIATEPAKPKEAAASLPAWQEKIIPERFAGKTIIVTGAGSGIGRATASRIVREGGRVIGVDISQERLDDFAASLSSPENLTFVVGDITNDDAIAKVVAAAGEQIDGLANVAGIMDNMTPLHEVTDEVWNKVFAVNVTGMMKLSRAVLPIMLKQHRGAIVNVASEASLRGSAAGVAYTASKHAVVGLTKSTAFMYADTGIRINAVAPGPVLTNIEARFDSELGAERVNALLANAPRSSRARSISCLNHFPAQQRRN